MNEKLPFDVLMKGYAHLTNERNLGAESVLESTPVIKDIGKETLSKLYLTESKTLKAVLFKDGIPVGTKKLIPDIKDVKVISNDESPKVVIVYFMDNTSEKAVLDSADTYSLEQGISICITKKLLAGGYEGVGSSIYNKIISRAMKVMKNNEKAKEEEAKRVAASEVKQKKIAEKNRKYREKVIAKIKEEETQIQAEAYYRALKKIGEETSEKLDKILDDFSQELLNISGDIENSTEDKNIKTVSELNENNK